MLKRKPTRITIEKADIDELDAIRKQYADTAEAAAAKNDPQAVPIIPKTEREISIDGKTVHERLGIRRGRPSSR